MTANLVSNIRIAQTAGVTPEVGMGATVCHYSDRSAGTVVAVRLKADGSVKEIDVRADKATRADNNGVSDAQSYSYEPGPEEWPVSTWRRDGKGTWRKLYRDRDTGNLRMESARHGVKLALGVREEFYDFTF